MPSQEQAFGLKRYNRIADRALEATDARLTGYLSKQADGPRWMSAGKDLMRAALLFQVALPATVGVIGGHIASRVTSPEPSEAKNVHKRLVLAELLKQHSALERKRTGSLRASLARLKDNARRKREAAEATKAEEPTVVTDDPIDSSDSGREIHIS